MSWAEQQLAAKDNSQDNGADNLQQLLLSLLSLVKS